MKIAFLILLTALGFLAVILNLALDTRFKARSMGFCACFAAVSGMLIYGYAYTWTSGLSVATLFRTLMTICRMFAGVNDLGTFSQTPLSRSDAAMAGFWLTHFLAFYVTASAAIAVLGQQLLKYLRVKLLRVGAVTLVYGATRQTARLVRLPRGSRGLVCVTRDDDDVSEALGGVSFQDDPDGRAAAELLRHISARRPLSVYCVSPDAGENLRFATALRDAMSARGMDGLNASLFLLGVSEARAVGLLASPGRCGFGSLFACDESELTARQAIRCLPPWSRVDFDADGRAAGDLRVLVVGFGRMGKAMLRHLVMNGQFEGSAFRAQVVDARMDALSGLMKARFSAMLEAYDIQLIQEDARSAAFYDRLEAHRPAIIALCAGSRKANMILAHALERYYELRDERPAIVQCAEGSVTLEDAEYRLENIDVRAMDRLAMVLNHTYCNGPSPEADWRTCDAFSRASCRASVDFYPAFCRMMGAETPEALERVWPPEGALLENMARTEHRRWCAFHLAMGYRPMTEAELDRRAARIKTGEDIRLGKDTRAMTHACLVPWEALDGLSDREFAATGRRVDYKRMDVNNILAIPEIMRRDSGERPLPS